MTRQQFEALKDFIKAEAKFATKIALDKNNFADWAKAEDALNKAFDNGDFE